MTTIRLLCAGTGLLLIAACGEGRGIVQPSKPFSVPSSELASSAAGPIQTSGHFDANVDFSTVTLTPKGQNCLLEVSGQLVFSGTIQGVANGVTSALEFAPCSEVATHPPGTFPDVFKSVAVFDGTIDGQPAHSNLLYMGRVAVGGTIDGRFVFSNGVAGEVDVNAIVAVGGEYSGSVVVK